MPVKINEYAFNKTVELKQQGLTYSQITERLGIGLTTAQRYWRIYKENQLKGK